MNRGSIGFGNLAPGPPAWMAGARLGLLSHAPSVGPDLAGAGNWWPGAFPAGLPSYSAPNTAAGEKQDNMIASAILPTPSSACRW